MKYFKEIIGFCIGLLIEIFALIFAKRTTATIWTLVFLAIGFLITVCTLYSLTTKLELLKTWLKE